MKFNFIFYLYCILLSFFIGILSSLFLAFTNFLIHFLWSDIPQHFNVSTYYPIIIGLTGGVLIGICQLTIGSYPRTMHETLDEYKSKKSIAYQGQIWRNFIPAVIVLACGASLGPEGALASILGCLISRLGNSMKISLSRKEDLLKLSIGVMMSAVFHAPLASIGEVFDDEDDHSLMSKQGKILLYSISTLSGLAGFFLINRLFPKEKVFGLHFPDVDWQITALPLSVFALIIGVVFGYLFLYTEKWFDLLAKQINRPFLLAVLGGLFIGLFGMVSSYFLFSGEHELLHFSDEALHMNVGFLLLIALGKTILTNLCFAFGWRGGKIFPAIFSSVAIGFFIAAIYPAMPVLIVAVTVASSVSIITKQPAVTAALLLLLFPVQFFPFILVGCFLATKFDKSIWSQYFNNKMLH